MPRVSKGSIDKHKEKAMVALRLPNIGVQELQKVKFKKMRDLILILDSLHLFLNLAHED